MPMFGLSYCSVTHSATGNSAGRTEMVKMIIAGIVFNITTSCDCMYLKQY